MANTSDIRNIVLLGHGGSGKTSLTEAILHKTGATNRLGSVDEKTSTCDYYDEEKEHQHSIQSAIVHVQPVKTPSFFGWRSSHIRDSIAAEVNRSGVSTSGFKWGSRMDNTLESRLRMISIIQINPNTVSGDTLEVLTNL